MEVPSAFPTFPAPMMATSGIRTAPQSCWPDGRVDCTERPGRCVLRDAPCPGNEECPIHLAWVEARAVLISGLESIPAVQS